MSNHTELGQLADAVRSIARLGWLMFWIMAAPFVLGAGLLTYFLLNWPI